MSLNNQLVHSIDAALGELALEMLAVRTGKSAIDSIRNLEFMRKRLETMKESLIQEGSEGMKHRGSMTHIINDTWPMNSELGSIISEVEYRYYHKK